MAETADPVLAQQLNEIFFPHFWEKRVALRDSDRKLVHYTSAENALRILTDKAIMLRSTVCMNDYSEVQHGHGLVQKCFLDDGAALHTQFVAALDDVFEGIAIEAFNLYDQHLKNNVFRTYVACISEHSPTEDDAGRLSMWRAYNQGATGVAIVLNKAPLFGNAGFVGFFASPVAYLRDSEVRSYIQRVINNVKERREFLCQQPRERIRDSIFLLLMFSAICIKHHGFEEEQEWRVIYLPALFPSDHLEQTSATIRGIPQIVYKLPLRDIPEKSLVGIEIPAFIEHIIIGPTQFPFPISEVLADALAKAGVENAVNRIHTSRIPLRT